MNRFKESETNFATPVLIFLATHILSTTKEGIWNHGNI